MFDGNLVIELGIGIDNGWMHGCTDRKRHRWMRWMMDRWVNT